MVRHIIIIMSPTKSGEHIVFTILDKYLSTTFLRNYFHCGFLKQYLISCLYFSGIKPFVCLICNTTFTRQHSLNYHMLIHNNQSRFTCKDCGRKFRHPSHFKVSFSCLNICCCKQLYFGTLILMNLLYKGINPALF